MKLLWNPTVMTFDFIVPEMEASAGVQKVGGFSRGWHHKNSIRCGIRKENNYYVLYLYAYVNGKFIVERIDERFEGKEHIYVELGFGLYTYVRICRYGQKEVWFGRQISNLSKSFPIGYQLYPYAETDGENPKKIPLNIKLNNVVIR